MKRKKKEKGRIYDLLESFIIYLMYFMNIFFFIMIIFFISYLLRSILSFW